MQSEEASPPKIKVPVVKLSKIELPEIKLPEVPLSKIELPEIKPPEVPLSPLPEIAAPAVQTPIEPRGVPPDQQLTPIESDIPVQIEYQISLPSADRNFLSTLDITQPDDKLKQSIEAFLLDQRSPHTRRAYGKDLKRFVKLKN